MKLEIWATKWGIPKVAIEDLRKTFGLAKLDLVDCGIQKSEAALLNLIRIEASKKDCRLWRNNVGATYTPDGNFIRYGLANESGKMNGYIKSADLIGIKPVKIRSAMVGMTIGQFVSREIKSIDWKYSGTDRERAQLRWIEVISGMGGDACFANCEGTL
jgi:hypothetical protein